MNNIIDSNNNFIDSIIDQVKLIDIEKVKFDDTIDKSPLVKEIESQKIYVWIRLYLKDEDKDIKEGDMFSIEYTPSGEKLKAKFFSYGKKGSIRNSENDSDIQSSLEDDKKILCLMVEEGHIQNGSNIPFIRTLFRISNYFEYQVYRRSELTFTNNRNNKSYDYVDCEF